MAFFNRMQKFFIFFILFGIWTIWKNSKYKHFLQLYQILSIAQFILNFLLAIVLDRLYEFSLLSNVVANFWFILSIFTHLIIVLESIFENKSQLKLIHSISRVDRIFAVKLCVKIAYQNEKHRIFVHLFMMMAIEIVTKIFFIIYSSIYRNELHKLFYVTLHSELMIALKLGQILFFVFIIDARLCLINRKLIEIQNPSVQITGKTLFKMKKRLKIIRAYVQLFNLKKIFQELHGICERIGHSFGHQFFLIGCHN